MSQNQHRVVGICFDHMHIGDQLAAAQESDLYQVVGVFDSQPKRMGEVCADLGIGSQMQYTDWEKLLDETQPELAVVCSTTADHLLWVERLSAKGIHIILEKPFATNTEDAKRAIRAAKNRGVQLAINWPLAWFAPHRTTKRLIDNGIIGDVIEIHYYDGNRGPQYHLHAKKEIKEPVDIQDSWWFKAAEGGGSLIDYLGYGATLATWFRNGELPEEVTAVSHVPEGFEVDLQSIVTARYPSGLSSLQTRWGTFTDPWVNQPQPFCGFVVVGTKGTIMSRDYAESVALQTRERPEVHQVPVDDFSENIDVFACMHSSLSSGEDISGPSGPDISLGGQLIVDAAALSVKERQPISIDRHQSFEGME